MQPKRIGFVVIAELLLQAMENVLKKRNLLVVCTALLLGAWTLPFVWLLPQDWPCPLSTVPWLAAGAIVLMLGSWCSVVITQVTFADLSQAKPPARFGDAASGWRRNAFRLVLVQLAVLGILILVIWGVDHLIRWVPSDWEDSLRQTAIAVPAIAMRLLLVVLGIMTILVQFASSVIVVEELSAGKALKQWIGFMRRSLGRVVLYEGLALGLAIAISLPLVLPLAWVSWNYPLPGFTNGSWPNVIQMVQNSFWVLAATPGVTYLLVANLQIYLKVRYDHHP